MYVEQNRVAMGAPLAPVMADIFMAHLETTLMDQLKQSGVCEWHRYVDDTFVLLEPKANVTDVLTILNNFHASMKFTYELEKDQSLSFLDVGVIRPQNSAIRDDHLQETNLHQINDQLALIRTATV